MKISINYKVFIGARMAQLVEAPRYKPGGRGFDGVIGIFL
jgi:hypothetical protein